MTTKLEMRIDVDKEVIEAGFTESEINEFIMRYGLCNLRFEKFNILTLPNKEQIRVYPYWTIANKLIITVSYF